MPSRLMARQSPLRYARRMQAITIRTATGEDTEVLTTLILKSKASWGYSPALMMAFRSELTMTPAKLAHWTVWVAEVDQTIRGMIALNSSAANGSAELEEFFVDPEFQKRGVGSALLSRLLHACRERGVTRLGLDADPYAEAIYASWGFSTVGASPSKSIAGRLLPRMELSLSAARGQRTG
jgi:N-acetylglutamate synthase-like GNAT family acetyltransferase